MSSHIHDLGLEHERSDPIFGGPRLSRGSIYSSVRWFKIAKDAFEMVEICNDYGRYREDGIKGTISRLPTGWSAHREPNDGSVFYRYDNAPSSYTFWYPVPIVRNPQPVSVRQWKPILYCKTWRSYLELGSQFPRENDKGRDRYPLYSLRNSDGEWAGVIYPHSPPKTSDEKETCELIVISNGRVEDRWVPEWDLRNKSYFEDHYEFYNVLWIEWQEGIAYRKGLGRVDQVVWDNLSTDEIDVFLG